MLKDNHITPEKALLRVQALCARQEKCSHDIRLKLKQWQVLNIDIERIVKKLAADNFLNDERFAKMFARDKSKFNKWGSIKITYTLKSKHISDEIIRIALAEIDHSSEESILKEMLSRKMKSIKSKSPYDLKTKLIRFGMSRGYNFETINKVVSVITKDS